jgi:hypothetical protein
MKVTDSFEIINFRCTTKEKTKIKDKAAALSMGISDYLRFVALKCEITVKAEIEQ